MCYITDILQNVRFVSFKVVELPYKEKQASMVIIVPDKIDGLADVEKKVIASNIKSDVFDQISNFNIALSIPKFKIETEINLKDILPKARITIIINFFREKKIIFFCLFTVKY